MLKLYGRLGAKAARLGARGWPLALLLLVYPYVLLGATSVLGRFGIAGGFVVGIVLTLLISSYLHLLAEVVAGRSFGFSDFKSSFLGRFWDVMSVLFSFWIIELVVSMLTRSMGPQGATVRALISLTMAVLLNPLPEVIYQRGGQGWFAPLGEAARFVFAHWPEWLLPNLLLAGILLLPLGILQSSAGAGLLGLSLVFSLQGLISLLAAIPIWVKPVVLLLVHFAMVFRGLLFAELSSGVSARQRAIRDAWGRRS